MGLAQEVKYQVQDQEIRRRKSERWTCDVTIDCDNVIVFVNFEYLVVSCSVFVLFTEKAWPRSQHLNKDSRQVQICVELPGNQGVQEGSGHREQGAVNQESESYRAGFPEPVRIKDSNN